MKFKAEIKLDNAAFEDNPEELSDIFKRIAERATDLHNPNSRFVYDSNGNQVGHWEIIETP